MARVSSVPVHVPIVHRAPIKELRRYGAIEFQGLKRVDPSTAEVLLEGTKRVLQQLKCNPCECTIYVVSLLHGEAYTWKQTITRHVHVE